MSNSNTATLTFRIDPSLKEALRIAAHAEYRSIANLIEVLFASTASNEALPSQIPKPRTRAESVHDQDG